MFSSKKETKNINFFKKLFASPKPHKKRRVAFFGVLLVFMVLGGILLIGDAVHAQSLDDQFNPGAPGSEVTITAPYTVAKEGGGAVADWAVTKVIQVVVGVLSIIAYFLKELVRYAAMTLDLTLNPDLYNFTSNNMIKQGWVIVRDVCNLFFLLILLFIAICTILKIEKYHAKKTLLMLIIMALLINFSKPIAIFIFDGSQLLMNFFLSQMGTTGSGVSTVVSEASKIANLVYDTLPQNSGETQVAIQYLFGVVFLFMLAIAFLVTALMLIIRIVVIMLLIIVSPFAFFAAIIPDFSKMSSQWWSALFEYSYYGPAAAFFLLLATQLQNSLPNLKSLGNGKTLDTTVYNIIHYLVVLVFLYASIIMAKKFGGGAGAAVTNWGNKSLKGGWLRKGGWPREIAGWGARTSGAADVYKGTKAGIAKQPVWRVLTKEGREAKSKERQAKWEGKAAPFNIATAKKQAKERENDAEKNIISDASKGVAAAILVASQRGYSKDGSGKDLWTNPNVTQTLQNDDVRKAAYGNLRDKGKAGLIIDSEIARQGIAEEAEIKSLYQKELGELSATNLGKQDLGELSKRDIGKEWVASRLKEFDQIDSRMITNMLSGGHANNVGFIRELKTGGALPNYSAQGDGQRGGNERGSRENIEVVSERPPRERTTYDADGRPIT